MARLCLVAFGLMLITTAIAGFVVPEVIHSEDTSRPPVADAMIQYGVLGYGVLLILAPGTLAARRAVTVTLVSVSLVFCAGIFILALSRESFVSAVFAVVVRIWPAFLALAMVAAESRCQRR